MIHPQKKSDLLKSTTLLKDRCNFISVKAKRIGSIGIINYDMRYVPHSGLSQKVDLSISETLLDCIINNVIVNWYNRAGIPRNGLRLKDVSTHNNEYKLNLKQNNTSRKIFISNTVKLG